MSIPKSLMPIVKKKKVDIAKARAEWNDKHGGGNGRAPSASAVERGRSQTRNNDNRERAPSRASSAKRAKTLNNLFTKNDPNIGVCKLALCGKCPEQSKAKCKEGRHVDPAVHNKKVEEWKAAMAKHINNLQQ